MALGVALLVCPRAERGALASPPVGEAAKAKPDGKKAAETAMRAVKLYREGRHDEAARLFLEAYQVSGRPALLRNAAKAYEEGGRLDEALALWGRYGEHEGVSDEEKAEAAARAQQLRAELRTRAAAAEQARQAEAPARGEAERARGAPAASERERRAPPARAETTRGAPVGGWVLVGAGGAALVAGAVVWSLASSRLSALDDKLATVDAAGLVVGTDPGEVAREVSGVNTLRVVSGVLLAVGVTAAGSGAAWLLFGSADGGSAHAGPRAALAPLWSADGAGLGVAGVF